jgi:predicted O-methyltransferase YrrM
MPLSLQKLVTGIRSADNTAYTLGFIDKLTRDEVWIDTIIHMIKQDVLETRRALSCLAELLKPRRYLEIGVRRGLSMAMVAGRVPDCDITGMDVWIENYAGASNPGPDFVRREMQRVGFSGQLQFITGVTQDTLPEFVGNQPEPFDLINVDGDHTYEGARSDLWLSILVLKKGGVLLFDDIHGEIVSKVWADCKAELPQYLYYDIQKFGVLQK